MTSLIRVLWHVRLWGASSSERVATASSRLPVFCAAFGVDLMDGSGPQVGPFSCTILLFEGCTISRTHIT